MIKQKLMPQKFGKRKMRLTDKAVIDRAVSMLRNLPVDPVNPLQLVVQDEPKKRSNDANAAMWAGPLRDISEQAWVDGKQFSAEIWAHYFKVQLLPEDFDPELCLEGYSKWSYGPDGERVLTGSTTQLTPKGFAQYVQAMEAFGGNLGVQYSARPIE